MFDGSCPPTDVWADFEPQTLDHFGEDRALMHDLHDHLKQCRQCRHHWKSLHRRPADRSQRLATWATILFGMLGFALVLMISLRTPPHRPTADRVENTPATSPTPNELTGVIPVVIPPSSEPNGE
ncbi:MAG: hypothetical protein KDB14_16525 [Planctomycetales bacterium]|nr:hypothetical protein [Planctomycetales bacterium]